MQPGNTATSDLPTFDEAVNEFAAFLRREGAPDRVRWVFREDVTSHRRRIWLRFRLKADEAERLAKATYDMGRVSGFGISLRAVCRAGLVIAAYVWVPEDETAASYAMQPRSLKCQVPVPLDTATAVRSAAYWWFRRFVNGCRRDGNVYVNDLPRHTTVAGRP